MTSRLALALCLVGAAACSRSAGPQPTAPTQAPAAAPARAAAPAEQPVRYAAGASRYRVETQQHTEQDMMGNVQAFDATTTQLLSLTLAPVADALGITVTIDSIAITTDAPGGMEAAATVRQQIQGKRFTGTMTPTGRIVALTAGDSLTDQLTQIMNNVREFLPSLPEGALPEGREWTDTVSNAQSMGPMNVTTRSIRAHRIAGWDTRDGARALRVTTRNTYTVTGSGETQGQALEVAGQGRGVSERFLSAAGVFLGGTTADTTEINVNVVSAGMTIPIRQTERATVTRLP